MVKRFISYYKPHKKIFFADMLCSLILAVCDLFYPMITRNIINDYIPNQNMRLLITWVIIVLLIYVAKIGLNYFVQYYGHIVGVGMQKQMRKDIFDRLQKMPFTFFDNNKTGTIMSRIMNDLMDISELAHHGPEDLFLSVLLFIGAFILLARINLWLTLIMFLIIPFMIIFTMKKRVKLADAFKETREEIAEVNANLENSISGIRVSKAYTNAEYENENFEKGNMLFVNARKNAYKVMAEFHSGNTFFSDVLYIAVLLGGGLFTYFDIINFGDFTAFILFVGVFLNPIRRIIGFVEQFQNGMSGFQRFVEIMDSPIEVDEPDAVVLENVAGDIQFDDVSFAYDENSSVLSHVSLHIAKGNTIALVGPSGGGKTTLCHIIPRFYEINGGTVYLDGRDIRTITRESLRKNIGIVAQDVFLFTGTIYDNIAYGCPDATEDQVYEAARRANIHDFILSLPEGYESFVGERGVKLSGGQKQRISIARIFLKDPPILILDEATSALDNATEYLIQQSLEELCKGRTTLIVAHRLSTVKNADEIIVITDEGIMERGTHNQLLDIEGIYASLYNSQFEIKTAV